jgi:cobalt/nickel transport protein
MQQRKTLAGILAALALTLVLPGLALAHFQMIYTPEIALDKGGEVDMRLVFTHPFEAGHTMDMGTPEQFFMVYQKGGEGEPQKTDLKAGLTPITWKSLTNSGKAFAVKQKLRSPGDYVFALVPAPYLEPEEGAYMQQITKMVLNVGGIPGNWDKPVGLPAEIVPLAKPYGLYTGNVFVGQVLANGKPVPDAEIEVEYLNHVPNMGTNSFDKKAVATAPHDCFITQTIKADSNGVFVYAMPKAGWWGFAALGVGPVKEFDGKAMSQDALIWVKAVDMK